MLPSSVSKRKKVTKELFDNSVSILPGEFICKLLKSCGNYMFTAKTEHENGDEILVSIPERFRNAFYFTQGSYVICLPLDHRKIKGEIKAVLQDNQIQELMNNKQWPNCFKVQLDAKISNKNADYISSDLLPSTSDLSESDEDYSEEDSDDIQVIYDSKENENKK